MSIGGSFMASSKWVRAAMPALPGVEPPRSMRWAVECMTNSTRPSNSTGRSRLMSDWCSDPRHGSFTTMTSPSRQASSSHSAMQKLTMGWDVKAWWVHPSQFATVSYPPSTRMWTTVVQSMKSRTADENAPRRRASFMSWLISIRAYRMVSSCSRGNSVGIGVLLDGDGDGVAVEHRSVLPGDLPDGVRRQVADLPVDHRLGVRPGGVDVGVVGLQQHVLGADAVDGAEGGGVLDGAEPEVPLQHLGRAELLAGPGAVHVAVPLHVVEAVQQPGHPADAPLGDDDAQVREPQRHL